MYNSALEVLKKINDFGYKAYIVGGYPRDLYLNRDSVDIDICTNATPKDLNDIFKNSILPKQEYGGVTILYNKIRFEITTFRKEIKYENNRFPVKIKYIDTLIDDLERRDFTINTLCMNASGEVIDLLNAKCDIDNKLIKVVGNSDKKIKEDILRSLRAIRFATVLNFSLDEELKSSIIKTSSLLKSLSYYRKKEELEKIFSNHNCKYGINLIKELGLDKALELSNLDNIVITTSPLGMWAQLDVIDKYVFSLHEQEIIKGIQQVLSLNVLDNNVLYKYGLYICTLVGEIKKIDRALIVAKYNSLSIKSSNDINITPLEICSILNKKPDKFIKNIINDLEEKIVNEKLENNLEAIINYIRSNYEC